MMHPSLRPCLGLYFGEGYRIPRLQVGSLKGYSLDRLFVDDAGSVGVVSLKRGGLGGLEKAVHFEL